MPARREALGLAQLDCASQAPGARQRAKVLLSVYDRKDLEFITRHCGLKLSANGRARKKEELVAQLFAHGVQGSALRGVRWGDRPARQRRAAGPDSSPSTGTAAAVSVAGMQYQGCPQVWTQIYH